MADSILFTLPIPLGSKLTNDRYGPGAPVVYGRRRIGTVTSVTVTPETPSDLDGHSGHEPPLLTLAVLVDLSPSVGDFAAILDRGATDHLSLPQENP
jgi:hypothetical protein